MSGVSKTPFARVKTWDTDITYEQARARGYIKGNMKKETFFDISKRETTPTTIYIKQKIDRDDWVDVGSFDIVTYMKQIMDILYEEETARVILFGDGRAVDDPDRVDPTKIRPIVTDDDYYTHKVHFSSTALPESVIDTLIETRMYYKGDANPTMYIDEALLVSMLNSKDLNGRRIYDNLGNLESVLRVSKIVAIDMDYYSTVPGLKVLLVNLSDYNVGANPNGQPSFFDDFDIDFNKMKYLKEGRFSGALTRPKTAMAYFAAATTSEAAPAVTELNNVVTIGTDDEAGVTYTDQHGHAYIPGTTVTLTPEEPFLKIRASLAPGYVLGEGSTTGPWTFKFKA